MENEGIQPFALRTHRRAGTVAAGRDVLRQHDIQFQPGEAEAAHEAGDEQRGQHRGQDQEQQVVGGDRRGHGDQRDGKGEHGAAARNPVARSRATCSCPHGATTMAQSSFMSSPTPRLRRSLRALGSRVLRDRPDPAHRAHAALRRRQPGGPRPRRHHDPDRHVRDAVHGDQLRAHGARLPERGLGLHLRRAGRSTPAWASSPAGAW